MLGNVNLDIRVLEIPLSPLLIFFSEPHENPELSQVELRNIAEEILNLEEYLVSTRKDESVSQDIFYHGGKAHNYAITEEQLDGIFLVN
jgi:hypothetical protein